MAPIIPQWLLPPNLAVFARLRVQTLPRAFTILLSNSFPILHPSSSNLDPFHRHLSDDSPFSTRTSSLPRFPLVDDNKIRLNTSLYPVFDSRPLRRLTLCYLSPSILIPPFLRLIYLRCFPFFFSFSHPRNLPRRSCKRRIARARCAGRYHLLRDRPASSPAVIRSKSPVTAAPEESSRLREACLAPFFAEWGVARRRKTCC